MRVVISDTSPIRYLVLIGEAELLQRLYGRVLIPQTLRAELKTPRTPAVVREWVESSHAWIEVVQERQSHSMPLVSSSLDPGERAAIALALDLSADLLLMDERAGVEEARRLGLNATGTLGVLARGAERGFTDLASAVEKLRATNFRVQSELIQQLLLDDARRHKDEE
jgi:predicted nucleic acid-binding protein